MDSILVMMPNGFSCFSKIRLVQVFKLGLTLEPNCNNHKILDKSAHSSVWVLTVMFYVSVIGYWVIILGMMRKGLIGFCLWLKSPLQVSIYAHKVYKESNKSYGDQ